jgi:hypothetical protein
LECKRKKNHRLRSAHFTKKQKEEIGKSLRTINKINKKSPARSREKKRGTGTLYNCCIYNYLQNKYMGERDL